MTADSFLSDYAELVTRGARFYPIKGDKSPTVSGQLDKEASADPIKLRCWIEHNHHRSFAARLARGSKLIAIDTESPFKHPGRIGPDGELIFCDLLEEHDIWLPRCPFVLTPSMGCHRYMTVPKGIKVRTSINLWPGVDVLAGGASVILPGSRTESGEYEAVVGFADCSIPEAPRELLALIRERQKAVSSRVVGKCSVPPPFDFGTEVSKRQWGLLFRNRNFKSFWNREPKTGDTSDSAYEYHLAKACFCCGLGERQVLAVLISWGNKHGLKRSARKVAKVIIPAAWKEVSPWVLRWQAEQQAARDAKAASKTISMIQSYLAASGQPETPSSVAASLSIPRERVKKTLQRMAAAGLVRRTKDGYIPDASVGTFSCITTPI